MPTTRTPAEEKRPVKPEKLPADLSFVFDTGTSFVAVRPGDLLESAPLKKLTPRVKEELKRTTDRTQKYLGIAIADVERLTFLLPAPPEIDPVIVVRTLKPYDRDAVLKAMQLGDKQEKYRGLTLFAGRAEDPSLCVIDGQTFAADGRIVFCEQNGRRVSRMDIDGTAVETVVETYEGKRLNSPNDIVARSDGLLYFTDPPYGVPRPEDKELPFQGVFALDASGGLRLLADDFEKPNGLAFSPDERTLYVNDTARYHIRAFAVEPDGRPR